MHARSLATLALLVAVGGVVGYQISARVRVQDPESATQAAATSSFRRELVLVYIGSSTCGPSNDPRLTAWIREATDTLRYRARNTGTAVITVGVARELDVAAGISHLARTAVFDELSVGQRERNHLSQKYIARDFPGIAATPQVLVLFREYEELPLGGIDAGSVRETLLLRRVGLLEVENWLRLGSPIPSFPPLPLKRGGSAVPL